MNVVASSVAVLFASGLALADVPKGKPTLLSKDPTGGGALGAHSRDPAISANGRYVAFVTLSDTLVGAPANGLSQVVVLDRVAGTYQLASRALAGGPVNDNCQSVGISSDGRYVVFQTAATNLALFDASTDKDVYRYDRQTQTVLRVSTNSQGQKANDDSSNPAISGDGRFVAFQSLATNLGGTSNGKSQVYLRDMTLGTTSMLSVTAQSQGGNDDSTEPTISDDGEKITFVSEADDLGDAAASLGLSNIWLRDLTQNTLTMVSKSHVSSAVPDKFSSFGSISSDGRYVAFSSGASNLVPSDPNGNGVDIFLYDTKKNKLTRIEVDLPGVFEDSIDKVVPNKKAKFISFRVAENVQHGSNDAIGLLDVKKKTVKLLSKLPNSAGGGNADDGSNNDSAISSNGKYVAFDSASSLIGPDHDVFADVFLFKR